MQQVDDDPFNRGKLMNVGYKEAMKYFPYDCLVFHDVDLLLEDDRMMYNCQSSPQHLSVSLNKFKYRFVYSTHLLKYIFRVTNSKILIEIKTSSYYNSDIVQKIKNPI